MTPPITDEIRYRILSYLDEHSDVSQRDVARHLGVSVGKVNYCLRALLEKGWLKIQSFRAKSPRTRRLSYTYNLTPKGVEEKVNVTVRFLKRKIEEYDALSAEIERLNRELASSSGIHSEAAKSSTP